MHWRRFFCSICDLEHFFFDWTSFNGILMRAIRSQADVKLVYDACYFYLRVKVRIYQRQQFTIRSITPSEQQIWQSPKVISFVFLRICNAFPPRERDWIPIRSFSFVGKSCFLFHLSFLPVVSNENQFNKFSSDWRTERIPLLNTCRTWNWWILSSFCYWLCPSSKTLKPEFHCSE